MAEICRSCGKEEYEFSSYCGAWVCPECSDHKGLGRCYCGWNLRSGERLEDDVGEARFIQGGWEVEY